MKTIVKKESFWSRMDTIILAFVSIFLQAHLIIAHFEHNALYFIRENMEIVVYSFCAFNYIYVFVKLCDKIKNKTRTILLSILTPLLYTLHILLYNNLLRVAERPIAGTEFFEYLWIFLKNDITYTYSYGEFRYPLAFLVVLISCIVAAILTPQRIRHMWHTFVISICDKFNEPLYKLYNLPEYVAEQPSYITKHKEDTFILTDNPLENFLPTLETERLILKEFNQNDTKAIAEVYSNDKEYRLYCPNASIDAIHTYVNRLYTQSGKDRRNAWVVSLKPGPIIAVLTFTKSIDTGAIRLDLKCNERYSEQGYIEEAIGAALKSCFEDIGLHKLCFECEESNEKYRRLYESLGLHYEGTELDGFFKNERYYNICHYCIINNSKSFSSGGEYSVFDQTGGNECEILFEYSENWRSEKRYIVFCDYTFDDNDNYKAFAATYNRTEDHPKLMPIESQEEFDILADILRKNDY